MTLRRYRRPTKLSFSKWAMIVIVFVAIVDLNICIFLGQEAIAISLITEIIGVFLTYCIKAYYGKRNEEENKLRKEMNDGLHDDI